MSTPNAGLDSGTNSSAPSPRRALSRPPSAAAYGLVGSPGRSRSPGADLGSTSSMRSIVRVDDLRRALSTSRRGAPRTSHSQHAPMERRRKLSREGDSSASDSMVSVHSISDASFLTTSHDPRSSSPIIDGGSGGGGETPAATLTPRPGTAITLDTKNESTSKHTANGVPPVPPIPASLRTSSAYSPPDPAPQNSHFVPDALAQSETHDFASRPKTAPNGNGIENGSVAVGKSHGVRSTGGRGRSGERRASGRVGGEFESRSESVAGKPDFTGFLDSIEGDDGIDDKDLGEEGDDGFLGAGKAPY